MNKEKIKKLESMGLKVTTTKDWLKLSVEEEKVVEMRIALAAELEKMRKEKGMTQAQLAKRLGTKQSGVARMINSPDSATIDNLIKAMVSMGASVGRIAACLLLCTAAN